MLRRGHTATSLSIPGHQSTLDCLSHAMTLQGSHLCGVLNGLPNLEQITVGGGCLATASVPTSRFDCMECRNAFVMQMYFGSFLSRVKVCSSSSSFRQATSCAYG